MTGIHQALLRRARQARYTTRYLLNGYPALYTPLVRLRHRSRDDRLVRRDTELVIEGFGRSGNTFAVVAFLDAQDRPVRLVHHTHGSAQIIRAVRLGVPTVLLVRDPVDTVVSHLMYRDVSARAAILAWIRYHRRVLPYRHGIVVAPFERSTADLAGVIREVNDRFGTTFRSFEHSEEHVQRVFGRIEQQNRDRYGRLTATISRPTAEREQRKAALRREVQSPRLLEQREQAYEIYRGLVAPDGD
jgi:hypothetical protein